MWHSAVVALVSARVGQLVEVRRARLSVVTAGAHANLYRPAKAQVVCGAASGAPVRCAAFKSGHSRCSPVAFPATSIVIVALTASRAAPSTEPSTLEADVTDGLRIANGRMTRLAGEVAGVIVAAPAAARRRCGEMIARGRHEACPRGAGNGEIGPALLAVHLRRLGRDTVLCEGRCVDVN